MAEELLVHGAGEILSRIVSLGFDEIGLVLGVKDELQKLHRILINIQQVTHDAEQKQVKERRLIGWLKELKQVAYDVEDVLDDLAYEKLRQHIINNNNSINSKGCFYISGFIKKLWLYCKIAHQIKHINLRLADINNRKNMFNLEPSSCSSHNPVPNLRRETAAFVDDSTVVGRESYKDDVVTKLLSHGSTASSSNVPATNNDFQTVAITGLGGIGKTTLAQLAYKDDAIKKHFDLRVWICVSDDFNTTNLFAQILQQIPGGVKPESSTTKQVLQNNLQSGLKEKKFLLVLDDVWNENRQDWDDFVLPLKNFCASGSRVLVTSRCGEVALIVRAQDPCKLEGLSDDSCWALIKRQAFMDGEPPNIENLVEIGKDISKKCKGVPLAAKALGGILQSMKEERQWEAVRDAEFRNLLALPGNENENDEVIGVLKYSFDRLSPTLKSCFTYCAIFPKDYQISKEILIQLWMAQGFLDASGTRGEFSMEDYGNAYFKSLYSKSFFQEAEMNDFGEVIYCKMHDLVQELAQYVCESECEIIGDNNEKSNSKCRHASLISSNPLEALKDAKKLRTIFILESDCELVVSRASTFSDFVLLRVLDLSYSGCYGFPFSSHCKLKHLRYLDLSYTRIESLPTWVTQLYNLQTLKLIECNKLIKLPEDLKNLKNLRHLFIDEYRKWKKMPQAMGELVDLQTLPMFVACEEDDGRGISLLNKLNNLQGTLDIHHLYVVKEGSLAKEAYLIGKSNLQELGLHWDRNPFVVGDICNDLHVMEELRPHTNLQRLSLEGFGGDKFPEWVSSGSNLPRLMSMELVDFNYCEHIPSFDELPRLQSIKMKHMSGVKRICGVSGASQSSYIHLKNLELRSIPNLEEWSGDAGVLFPSLKSLILDDVGGMGVVSITNSLTSLTSLRIEKCRGLEFLPKGLLKNNNQLNDVVVSECPKLQALQEGLTDDEIDFVAKSSLRELQILRCDTLKSIPDMRGFTSLQSLLIYQCGELKTIAKGFLSSLVSLESLSVYWCPNFEGFHDNNFKQLHTLDITYCPAVRSIELQSFSSLRGLEITRCRGLQTLQGLPFLTALEYLAIGPLSDELDCFPSFDGVTTNNPLLPSLRKLQINGWAALTSLPHHLQRLTTLKSLTIKSFTNLRELPEWLGDLASLERLWIYKCENLRHLPSKEQMQRLIVLKRLDIMDCPLLEERCRRRDGDGPEWPKISHIPEICIDDIRANTRLL